MLQAGDSEEGREFAARYADGIFTRHGTLEAGQAFYADVKGRLARYGRSPEEMLILPGTTFVLGDTDADARERAHHVRRQQVTGAHAILFLEQLWNRDLSAYDPDGPLPDIDPDISSEARAQGSAAARSLNREAVATARQWRERAQAGRLSIRELVIEMTNRQTFTGSPATVAEALNAHVQATASSSSLTSPQAGSTGSPTRSCRCSRSAASSAPSTPAPPSASTSGSIGRRPAPSRPHFSSATGARK